MPAGPAGVAVIRSLLRRADVDGLRRRHGRLGERPLPRARRAPPASCRPGRAGRSSTRSSRSCAADAIDVVFSTVDVELPPLADAPRRARRPALAAPQLETLARRASTSALLAERCAPHAARARHRAARPRRASADDWDVPGHRQAAQRCRLARRAARRRPRARSRRSARTTSTRSSRRTCRARSSRSTCSPPLDGHVIAAVPRLARPGRLRCRRSPAAPCTARELESTRPRPCARAIGLTGVANVQLRYATARHPRPARDQPALPGRDAAHDRRRRRHAVARARPRARDARCPSAVDVRRDSPTCATSRTSSSTRPTCSSPRTPPTPRGERRMTRVIRRAARGDYHVHSHVLRRRRQHHRREHRRGGCGAASSSSGSSTTCGRHDVGARVRRGRRAPSPYPSGLHGAHGRRGEDPGRDGRPRHPGRPRRRAGGVDGDRDRRPPVPRHRTARGRLERTRERAGMPGCRRRMLSTMLVTASVRRDASARRDGAARALVLDPAQDRPARGRAGRRSQLAAWADAAARTGTIIEVNEKWACPGPRAPSPR